MISFFLLVNDEGEVVQRSEQWNHKSAIFL